VDVATIGLIQDEDILLDMASLAVSHLDHEISPLSRKARRDRGPGVR
jgi:hypothetical protein